MSVTTVRLQTDVELNYTGFSQLPGVLCKTAFYTGGHCFAVLTKLSIQTVSSSVSYTNL